jgi:hypothetical protein
MKHTYTSLEIKGSSSGGTFSAGQRINVVKCYPSSQTKGTILAFFALGGAIVGDGGASSVKKTYVDKSSLSLKGVSSKLPVNPYGYLYRKRRIATLSKLGRNAI